MIKQAIRTFAGITFRSKETRMLEHNRTNVVATPIPMPFSTVLVTASMGHNPRTSRNGGISSQSPLVNSCAIDLAIWFSPCDLAGYFGNDFSCSASWDFIRS